MVSVYHLLLAIAQDDLAGELTQVVSITTSLKNESVPLRTIPYLAREAYKAAKLVLLCLWRPDLITIRVAMGDSCYMLFAIPSCAFTYVDGKWYIVRHRKYMLTNPYRATSSISEQGYGCLRLLSQN